MTNKEEEELLKTFTENSAPSEAPVTMKIEEVKKTFEVEIIESERGWGQKVDERKYFKSAEEADKFVKQYNSENTEENVPDWYMYARRTN